jgi:hypothetical protein
MSNLQKIKKKYKIAGDIVRKLLLRTSFADTEDIKQSQ